MAAVYSLFSWYGISAGISLRTLVWVFWGVVLACGSAGVRQIALRSRVNQRAIVLWVFAFSLFYIVAYAFFTPTVSGADLPLVSYYNNDLMNYLNFTRALQDLRFPNVAGMSFLTSSQYFQTPAAFSLLGLFSTFFGMEPMRAAMPALFGLCALIALVSARISRSVFHLSFPWALAIGATLISGPFFRYIAGNYFLSSLIALPIFVHLLWVTIASKESGGAAALALQCLAHYVVLLLTYPVLLVIAVAVQCGICLVAHSLTKVGVVAVAVLGMAALAPQAAVNGFRNVVHLSQSGVSRWPLEFISPLALIGAPGSVDHLQIRELQHPGVVVALLITGLAMLIASYFWWERQSTTTEERLWVLVGAGSVPLYCLAYFVLGQSYQQWKLASYLPLPLSFVLFAAAARMGTVVFEARAVSRLIAVSLPAALAAVFVGGNLRVHASDEPPLRRFPASFANLAQIDDLKTFQSMYVEMDSFVVTFMPVYFIRHKELHLISESYYPREPLVLDRVSRSWPYFTQNFDCGGVGHSNTKTIEGVGCLLFEPPGPQLDVSYPFSREYMFVTTKEGFVDPEPWGRWVIGHLAAFELEADAQRVPLGQPLYLNLLIRPYVPPKASGQHLLFSWGDARRGEIELARQEWVSVPLQKDDWKGTRVRTTPIRIDVPGATAPASVENSPERRELGIAFIDLTLSEAARGQIVR
jgi:hypothetical protein